MSFSKGKVTIVSRAALTGIKESMEMFSVFFTLMWDPVRFIMVVLYLKKKKDNRVKGTRTIRRITVEMIINVR